MTKLSMGERMKIRMDQFTQERKHFEDHPEEYPYYVLDIVRWPSKSAYQYNITNIPIKWYEASIETGHAAIVRGKTGEKPAEIKKVARDLCIQMNTERCKLALLYEPAYEV